MQDRGVSPTPSLTSSQRRNPLACILQQVAQQQTECSTPVLLSSSILDQSSSNTVGAQGSKVEVVLMSSGDVGRTSLTGGQQSSGTPYAWQSTTASTIDIGTGAASGAAEADVDTGPRVAADADQVGAALSG